MNTFMGQIYMQNGSCEWVPIVQAEFDGVTTECQPDATGIEFASFGQRNVSFTCEMTGPSTRRFQRYFIDQWRTKHGPVRRRLRSKALCKMYPYLNQWRFF